MQCPYLYQPPDLAALSLDCKCGQVNVTIQVTYSVIPAVSVPRGANKIIILTITMPK